MRALSCSSVSAMGRLFHWPSLRSLKSGSTSIGTVPSTPLMIDAVWRVRMSEPATITPIAQVHLLDLLGKEVCLVAPDVHHRNVQVATAAEAPKIRFRDAVAYEIERGMACRPGTSSSSSPGKSLPCVSSQGGAKNSIGLKGAGITGVTL